MKQKKQEKKEKRKFFVDFVESLIHFSNILVNLHNDYLFVITLTFDIAERVSYAAAEGENEEKEKKKECLSLQKKKKEQSMVQS
jgi:cell division protein FtsB